MSRRAVALAIAAVLSYPVGLATAGPASFEDPEALIRQALALANATEFDSAWQILEQARQHFVEKGDRYWEARLLVALGDVEGFSGARAQAVERHRQALRIFQQLGELRWQARAHSQIGKFDGSWDDFDRAEEIFLQLELPQQAAEVDAARAVFASQAAEHELAIEYAERALAVLEEGGRGEAIIGALSALGYSLQEMGELDRALAVYERLGRLAWQHRNQRVVEFTYCNRAELLRLKGQHRPAEAELREAIAGLERGRARIAGPPEQRAEYIERQVAAYTRLILLLADTYRGIEAFDVAERFHARSFLEMLDERDLDLAARASPELRDRERELLAELGEARLAFEGAPPEEASDRARLVEELELELRGLRNRARRSNPRYAALVTPDPPTLSEVQAGLETGETLVAYWVAPDRVFAWTVTGASAELTQVPISSEELRTAVHGYLENLRSAQRAEDASVRRLEGEHIELGRRLHKWLLGGLPAAAQGARSLIVVPDDVLHSLPFESLISDCPTADHESEAVHGRYRGCRFVGLDRAVIYNPSAGVLLALRLRQRERETGGEAAGQSMLAVAPGAAERSMIDNLQPLEHAAEEAGRVAALFDDASLVQGPAATEALVKRQAGRFRYLHLATHGLVRDDLPMTSGLVLGRAEGEDGLLQAYEVLALDLKADLVVASACRSGRGELHRGEGIVGLSRAFLHAGASAVLVSMWDVDDRSTPLLMESFYRHLNDGEGRAEALRLARAEVFERSREERLVFSTRQLALAHPRFWAPFVLIGTP